MGLASSSGMFDALCIDSGVNQFRSDIHALIRDRVVGEEHLHRRHRDALSNGNGRKGRARIFGRSENRPRCLVGKAERGFDSEAKCFLSGIERVFSKALRNFYSADIRRVGHDLSGVPRDGAATLRLAELGVKDLECRRKIELG